MTKDPDCVRLVGSTLGCKGLMPFDKTRTEMVKSFIRHTDADAHVA